MRRVAVILGSDPGTSASRRQTLPPSDRGAVSIALTKLGGDVRSYAADAGAEAYARAVGLERVEDFAGLELAPFDVALVGRGGCGERGDLLPALLAEHHGAALVYDVLDLEVNSADLSVTRDRGRGARDLLRVRGPSVLVVADTVARAPYVSHYRLNAAGAGCAASAAEAPSSTGQPAWQPMKPRVRLGDHASRVAGSAGDRRNALFGLVEADEGAANVIEGSVEHCVDQLLRYLGHHGFVERGAAGEVAGEPAEGPAAAVQVRQDEVSDRSVSARQRRRPRRAGERSGRGRGPSRIGDDSE